MSLKKWLTIFVLALVLCGSAFAGFNVLVDPFGVFGDPLFDWYAYDMTMNPRVAKIPYLEKHHKDYDSYIVGCSKTSSFSVDTLNRYTGDRFYSMTMYGGDMYDNEKTVEYLVKNYHPKNIVVNMGLEETATYDTESDGLKQNLHAKVDGSSQLMFYGKYLFLNPQYAVDKLNAYKDKGYLPGEHDIFIPEKGVYDKRVRDVAHIGEQENYEAEHPELWELYGNDTHMKAMDQCLNSVKRMKELCDREGVNFTVIMSPLYHKELAAYDKGELTEFWIRLARITDFWDFTGFHSVSHDSRYFYDAYHFRNSVGDMALARMFGDNEVYIPENFGTLVTEDNVISRIGTAFTDSGAVPETAYTAQVPILMYHELGPQSDNGVILPPEKLEEQIRALSKAGYTALFFSDLVDYVEKGTPLPEKPVVITFDDGYESNYVYAKPILEKYGMKATVNVIGISVGKDTYRYTGKKIRPHFDYIEAREMYQSGIFDLQSHSYDLHQEKFYEGDDYRQGVYPLPGETEEEYIKMFCEDFKQSKTKLESNVGNKVIEFAYPYGFNTTFSEALLTEMGVKVTTTVEEGNNTIVKGLPQSLLTMNRFNVTGWISGKQLVEMIGG